MADNNYLLFYIIEKIEKNTNKDYFTKEEILDYIKPIGLFGYAHNDYNFYISIVRNIIFNIKIILFYKMILNYLLIKSIFIILNIKKIILMKSIK